jgi:hypothetical protein
MWGQKRSEAGVKARALKLRLKDAWTCGGGEMNAERVLGFSGRIFNIALGRSDHFVSALVPKYSTAAALHGSLLFYPFNKTLDMGGGHPTFRYDEIVCIGAFPWRSQRQ